MRARMCDRCGVYGRMNPQESNVDDGWRCVKFGSFLYREERVVASSTTDADLCPECSQALRAWLACDTGPGPSRRSASVLA